MDILHIGLGTRGRRWFEAVWNRADATPVGCVETDADDRAWVAATYPQVGCYDDLGQALQHVKADVALIAGSTTRQVERAIEALEGGLTVVLVPPFGDTLAHGAQVMTVARRTGRRVIVAQPDRYRRCARALQTLVEAQKVGTITHVSCSDRRTRVEGHYDKAQDAYIQVLEAGVHHFDSLRSILGVNPVQVMAQCRQAPWCDGPHGTTTMAFFEMENCIHVQYYGSLTSNRQAYELRIEGDRGVLCTDLRRVWWRKRGARFFLPLRLPKIPLADASGGAREGMALLFDQLYDMVHRGGVPDTHGDDNVWSLAMVEAVIVADRTSRPVDISALFAAAGMQPTLLS